MLTIEHPLTGSKLQVANQDFTQEMTWIDAKRACNELGSGWRLPTIDELKAIHEQLYNKGQGNFNVKWCYWSSTEYNDYNVWIFSITGCEAYNEGDKHSKYNVRAVRNFS
jgi:hypothetical protein